MEHVLWTDGHPPLRDPILLAAFEGWGDAGDAASTAARHIRDRLGGDIFAEIEPEPFYDFTDSRPMVRIEDEGRQIDWPDNAFAAISLPDASRDLIVLVGVEPQLLWKTYTRQILSVVDAFDVKLVVTMGALIADVVHSRPTRVYTAGYDTELNKRLDLQAPTYEGPTGIVGVLHDALATHDIGSVSLWGSVPSYVPNATSPKAALALVEKAAEVLQLSVPTTALEIGAAAYERQVTELIDDHHETQAYVAELEEAYDSMQPESGADLISELEQYLKEL